MTQFENPNAGRAEIYESADLFQVRLKSKSSHFVMAFMMFWLCGWAYGEFKVLSILISGESGGASVFLLAWLGAWTVGGVFAATQLLWIVSGYELLSLSPNALTIQRCIPFYRRSWNYDINHVTNVRASAIVADDGTSRRKQYHPGIFSGPTQGTVKFDYGMKTPGFGLEMEEAEARKIADRLSAKLQSR